MDDRHMAEIIRLLEEELKRRELPIVSQLAEERRDPFEILISTLLSLRTKDEVTAAAAARLFAVADTPSGLADLDEARITEAIYPAGFYRTKARQIRGISRQLLDRHGGRVPAEREASHPASRGVVQGHGIAALDEDPPVGGPVQEADPLHLVVLAVHGGAAPPGHAHPVRGRLRALRHLPHRGGAGDDQGGGQQGPAEGG